MRHRRLFGLYRPDYNTLIASGLQQVLLMNPQLTPAGFLVSHLNLTGETLQLQGLKALSL